MPCKGKGGEGRNCECVMSSWLLFLNTYYCYTDRVCVCVCGVEGNLLRNSSKRGYHFKRVLMRLAPSFQNKVSLFPPSVYETEERNSKCWEEQVLQSLPKWPRDIWSPWAGALVAGNRSSYRENIRTAHVGVFSMWACWHWRLCPEGGR